MLAGGIHTRSPAHQEIQHRISRRSHHDTYEWSVVLARVWELSEAPNRRSRPAHSGVSRPRFAQVHFQSKKCNHGSTGRGRQDSDMR